MRVVQVDKAGGSTHKRVATTGLSPLMFEEWQAAHLSMGHRTHRALGIPPRREAFMLRAWEAEGSLGRKLYTWPVSVECRNPSLPAEHGGNQSCQAATGGKHLRPDKLAAYFRSQRKTMQRWGVGRGGHVPYGLH